MEVTVNKDTKTTGIVTIFSLKTGAVNRFYFTAEYRCAFLDQLRSLVQAKQPQFHHDEMQSPRMPKDEKQVLAVEALVESWNNPFARKPRPQQHLDSERSSCRYFIWLTSRLWDLRTRITAIQGGKASKLPKKKVYDPRKNWRCLRHSVRKQSRLREEPWYSRPTDLFSGEW